MVIDNFIKMGPEYINWSARVTSAEVELIKLYGTGSQRRVAKYKVVVKDLIDVLLFRCHGFNVLAKKEGMDVNVDNFSHKFEMDGSQVGLARNLYTVTMDVQYLKDLVRVNRATSKWDDIREMPRCVMDVPMLTEVLTKVIKASIINFSTKTSCTSNGTGLGVVITRAFIDEDEGKVHISLDKDLVNVLMPKNNYNTKYLADSFVLGSEYCKNLHSFISYYADVFKRGNWSNGSTYQYTSVSTVADAMGLRYSPDIRDYCKETNEYSRSSVVQFVKKYVKELNEKTRLSELFGELQFEVIRDEKNRGKVLGFKFKFEED